MILAAMLAVPLLGALAMLAPLPGSPRRVTRLARLHGLAVSGVTLVLAVVAAASFDYGRRGPQLGVNVPWAGSIGLRFHLGVDGISLPLVVLTAALTFLCMVYTARTLPDGGPPRALVGLILLLEVGMLGTFMALDLVLFFVFFEVVLVPMYFVIADWGSSAGAPRRAATGGAGAAAARRAAANGARAAATKFILYTLLGSGLLLVGILLLAVKAGTFDMTTLAARHGAGLSHGVQVAAFALMALGFAVKTPMWPLHTWLPDAHTEAPTVGSVLLAGVLLKMGTYGFIRIAVPTVPDGARLWAPWLGLLAVVGIVYGALACLAQRDLKRMIAYSSIGHMGFVLLGIATLTPVGLNAALFANVAHGLITGLLFFLAGAVKERFGTTDMDVLGGGMLAKAPYLASILTFAAVASFGLPGLAGFWGEMLALLGAFRPHAGLPRPTFVTFMAVGGAGALLTAVYFLRMLAKITHGAVAERWRRARFADVMSHELLAWTPLVTATLFIGLWPGTLLGLTDGAVRVLLGGR